MMVRITFNGEPREVSKGTSVADLLRLLDLPVQRVAVELNLDVVPRHRQAEVQLQEGDSVEVVTLVGGG